MGLNGRESVLENNRADKLFSLAGRKLKRAISRHMVWCAEENFYLYMVDAW